MATERDLDDCRVDLVVELRGRGESLDASSLGLGLAMKPNADTGDEQEDGGGDAGNDYPSARPRVRPVYSLVDSAAMSGSPSAAVAAAFITSPVPGWIIACPAAGSGTS